MLFPKLLVHQSGGLYAYRGFNQIAWRFGRQIKVCKVRKIIGPIYKKLSDDFFDSIDGYVKSR